MSESDVILEFVRRLGMEGLSNEGQPPVTLDLQGLGQLTIETTDYGGVLEDDLLVSLSLPLPPYDDTALPAVLALCHFSRGGAWPLSCGLVRDRLLLIVRQSRERAAANVLENQALFLIRTAQSLGLRD